MLFKYPSKSLHCKPVRMQATAEHRKYIAIVAEGLLAHPSADLHLWQRV
nr:MAG TPA: hypothetical protein [Caudoviricetes sp.]